MGPLIKECKSCNWQVPGDFTVCIHAWRLMMAIMNPEENERRLEVEDRTRNN